VRRGLPTEQSNLESIAKWLEKKELAMGFIKLEERFPEKKMTEGL